MELENAVYRTYVTDTLKIIAENTAKSVNPRLGGGYAPTKRYYEILNPKPVETRTADDVTAHMKSRLSALQEGGE